MSNLLIVAAALNVAFETLSSINNSKGKGSIDAITVDVNRTNLETGIVRGHVTRSICGGRKDQRSFGLTVKENGKVECRFLDKKQTVAA